MDPVTKGPGPALNPAYSEAALELCITEGLRDVDRRVMQSFTAYTSTPGPALLKSDYTNDLSRNLVQLAYEVQTLICLYQHNNPECKSSAVIQRWVLAQLMMKSRGHANPETLKHFISLERSVYTPDTDIMMWAI